jgi:hypothetical protein
MRSILHLARLVLWAVTVLLPAIEHANAAGHVYPSAEAVEPLAPGTQVPSARVETVRGDVVDLAEVVRKRGALLVFYRGGW